MKTLPKKLVLLLSILAITYSCEKDEIEQDIEQENLNFKIVSKFEAQNHFNAYQKNRDSITCKYSIPKNTLLEIHPDWSSFYHEDLNFEDAELSVVNIKTNANADIESRLIFININGKVIKVIKSEKIVDYKVDELTNKFIFFHNLEGDFILGYEMENGLLTKKFVKPDQSKQNTTLKAFSISKSDCEEDLNPNSVFCSESLPNVVVIAEITESEQTLIIDLHEYDRHFGIDPHAYGGNYQGGGSGSGTNNEEERIKNELDDPCAGNIFTELENGIFQDHPLKPEVQVPGENGLNLNFHESILKLFDDSSSTHLTIQNGNTDKNAFTLNTTITMGNGYLANATKLSIARTMIHESVHAYINGLYYRNSTLHDSSFSEKLRTWAGDNGYSDWGVIQHEFMGGYVDAIAYSLYDWDTKYGTGGNLGWDYYQAMAFAGLVNKKMDENGNPILDSNGNFTYEDTDSFKDLVPNENERDEIKKNKYR